MSVTFVYVVIRDDGALCSVHRTKEGARLKCEWLEKIGAEDVPHSFRKYSYAERILGE